ncbi:MAG: hypothetical protein KBC36_00705 [Spirochaetia bacterium]|nr:hypothetical protein [Spirochaetia bacterium]
MKYRLVVMFALLAAALSWGQTAIRGDAFVLEDQRVWLAMAHTPNGHLLQRAPFAVPYFEHLNVGAGPETLRYAFLGSIKEAYDADLAGFDRERLPVGTVKGRASISVKIAGPADSALAALPAGLNADKAGVRFAVAVLFGETNEPCFEGGGSTDYWLRLVANRPLLQPDGRALLGFSKLEQVLPAWFNEACTLDGEIRLGDLVIVARGVVVMKGWNLLGVLWGDGSEIFGGRRYLAALDPSTPLFPTFIPYW